MNVEQEPTTYTTPPDDVIWPWSKTTTVEVPALANFWVSVVEWPEKGTGWWVCVVVEDLRPRTAGHRLILPMSGPCDSYENAVRSGLTVAKDWVDKAFKKPGRRRK